MNDKIFIDTNILVYSVADDMRKRSAANSLLLQDGIVTSPQVISEFIVVTIRKRILEQYKSVEYAKKFLSVFHIAPMTADTVASALNIMTKYHFSYWDSLILAAAIQSMCSIVCTEDLQHGQQIENQITIINPFT